MQIETRRKNPGLTLWCFSNSARKLIAILFSASTIADKITKKRNKTGANLFYMAIEREKCRRDAIFKVLWLLRRGHFGHKNCGVKGTHICNQFAVVFLVGWRFTSSYTADEISTGIVFKRSSAQFTRKEMLCFEMPLQSGHIAYCYLSMQDWEFCVLWYDWILK